MSKRPVALNFHDSCLRQDDVDLLFGPFWLNDEVISFTFEYFTRVKYSEREDRFAFVSPSIVQLIKFYTPANLTELLDSWKLPTKTLLFLPINDNGSAQSAGGSHWSLLVYHKKNDCFYHFDSLGNSSQNYSIAVEIARSLCAVIRPSSSKKPKVKQGECSKQQNSYDCGIFVILLTELVADQHLDETEKQEFSKFCGITATLLLDYRQKWKQIIDDLREKQNQAELTS